jgi:pilus assembly protein CpaB
MNGKSLMMLGLAVVAGLGAMFLTSKLLSNGQAAPPVEMQDVLVAARDLNVEETLKAELVKVVQRPKSEVPPGSFSAFKDVEDRWIQIKTLEDEPILDKKLAAKGTPAGLVARIPKGMRAYAVDVNEQSGVSGFVLPGHRVDVVQIDNTREGQTDAETILQDVLVLASGQNLMRPDDKTVIAHTVTLAVTPDQVNSLVAAKAKGALTLSLRGLYDRERHDRKKPETAINIALKGEAAAPPPPPALPPPKPAVVQPTSPPPTDPSVARYLTIYKGTDRHKRIMLNKPKLSEESPAEATPDTFADDQGKVASDSESLPSDR